MQSGLGTARPTSEPSASCPALGRWCHVCLDAAGSACGRSLEHHFNYTSLTRTQFNPFLCLPVSDATRWLTSACCLPAGSKGGQTPALLLLLLLSHHILKPLDSMSCSFSWCVLCSDLGPDASSGTLLPPRQHTSS